MYTVLTSKVDFLTFQKAIWTIFISFANSKPYFDNFFDKIENFASINFALILL